MSIHVKATVEFKDCTVSTHGCYYEWREGKEICEVQNKLNVAASVREKQITLTDGSILPVVYKNKKFN